MRKKFVIILLNLIVLRGVLSAQDTPLFIGSKQPISTSIMDQYFTSYEIFLLDAEKIFASIHRADFNDRIKLVFDTLQFDITIIEHDLRHPDYQIQLLTDEGLRQIEPGPNVTYRGWNNKTNDGEIRLTITNNSIAGFMMDERGEAIYIQPVGDFLDDHNDKILLYRKSDVRQQDAMICASNHGHQIFELAPSNLPPSSGRSLVCKEAIVAMAADYSLYQKFGNNIDNLKNHLLTIKNMMEANYAVFEVEFSIVTNYIVTSAGSDPWSTTTNSGDLLDDFSCWGGTGTSTFLGCDGSNGFMVNHDMAELWTNRDFDGGTIGVAWINSVCANFFKYSVNQHFNSNLDALRALIAHEAGHNFGAGHDSEAGWIMSTPLSPSYTQFSTGSQNVINDAIPGFTCMTNCGTFLPLQLGDFAAKLDQAGQEVLVNWHTYSEVDFDRFELEHSIDGVSFIPLISLDGQGSPDDSAQYRYLHSDPGEGLNYYRLTGIDDDGSRHYSQVEVVFKPTAELAMYPNPAVDRLFFSTSEWKPVGYEIYNTSGQLLQQDNLDNALDNGLPVDALPAGIYTIVLIGAQRRTTNRFLMAN